MKRIIFNIMVSFAIVFLCFPVYAIDFEGLTAKHYAAPYVKKANLYNLMAGFPDKKINGDKNASRYDVALIFYNLINYASKFKNINFNKNSEHCGFNDIPTDHWAYTAVRETCSIGIMSGFPDQTFKGQKNLMRYEFSAVSSKLMDALNITGFARPVIIGQVKGKNYKLTDLTDVESNHWAYFAVQKAVEHGIVPIYADRTFKGIRNINIYEVVISSVKLVEAMKK